MTNAVHSSEYPALVLYSVYDRISGTSLQISTKETNTAIVPPIQNTWSPPVARRAVGRQGVPVAGHPGQVSHPLRVGV